MKKPLYRRLRGAYGNDALRDALRAMVSTYGDADPLRYITDEGKSILFKTLDRERKFANRIRKQNHATRAARDAAQQKVKS